MEDLDFHQIRISLERAVRVMRENLLRKLLSELNAFLVERVDVPYESLEHNLVLEMCKKRTEHFRSELVSIDEARRSFASERLVRVSVFLSASERHDLGDDVCAELFLARRILDYNISSGLILLECDELERNNVRSLMEQLIEAVLAVRSRLSENHRACDVADWLAESVHALSVRFHVELLQVRRES